MLIPNHRARFWRSFLAIRPPQPDTSPSPPPYQPTTKRLGQDSVVRQASIAWAARTSRQLDHRSITLSQHCTHHPPLGHHHGAAIASLPSADSQPCTTAANPLPGELQLRPPGCVCSRQVPLDSATGSLSLTVGSSCSSSACQTTLTRGLVLPIVCSAKA